jgi:L,D-transpeptidase YcbB
MIFFKGLSIGLVAMALTLVPAHADPDLLAAVPPEESKPASAALDTGAPPEIMAPAGPLAAALRDLAGRAALNETERDIEERAAVTAFYDSRGGAPLWVGDTAPNRHAAELAAEIAAAADWGLNPLDFTLAVPPLSQTALPATIAAAEMAHTVAALKYARYARGGRIMHPAADLSSYLDRAPQLMDPRSTLKELATAPDIGAYLRGLHPQHPQFEKLRQKYLAARGKGGKHLSAEAKRYLANMEQWRWMPADMGDFYVWNNIPEYTQRVMANGTMVHTERIVAGLLNKQTPIFSRPMRKIVFRPKWKVPESIKVREVWPSLVRGGGIMIEHGLQIETKEGQPVPTRSVDWATADIRNYEVIQPPGPRSVLGNIKFSFPNQHTVFMHDTQDKHLFAASQRTYSHGCMRVRNPAKLAEVILHADKGWDATKIAELIRSGPLDNEVMIDRKVPVHNTYFTVLIGDDGKVSTFRDVYGHERRITQALDGRWNEIVKGRDHLAPVEPDRVAAIRPRTAPVRAAAANKPFDFLGAVFGGF